MKTLWDLIIIGGGPAGYFMGIQTKEKQPDLRVCILEATSKPLSKILVSGGGRCNVTNQTHDPKELVKNYPRGSKELLSTFYRFGPLEVLSWFNSKGITFHTEADGRIFPNSNKSQTIFDCLSQEAENCGVEIRLKTKVLRVEQHEDQFNVATKDSWLKARSIALTSGSSPSAKKLAEDLGHTMVPPTPSLFTFKTTHPLLDGMQGISFSNASLKLNVLEKNFKQSGPLLITHWGLSGPGVLKLSAFGAVELARSKYQANLTVNFLGETSLESSLEQIKSHRSENLNQTLVKSNPFPFPKRFWQQVLDFHDLQLNSKWNGISKKQRLSIAQSLTQMTLQISGKGIFKEEFVTAGGIHLKEVNFKTMESKIVKNLFFAGEVLDIDGITGGFNFQNAWTTGWVAAQEIASR